jgi:hypothetical protein
VLGTDLSQFLEEFPFAKAELLAKHFGESKYTIKEILNREFGVQMFSRRCVSHSLSGSQKVDRMRKARYMLDVLLEQRDKSFNGIVTSDDSWFVYLYPSDHMFVFGREDVILREKQIIGSARSC